MSNPKIDWSDLENIEPVPGGDWDGWKIIGSYRSNSDNCPNLLVFENSDGRCAAATFTDDGRIWINSPPAIRNKPKRVTLQECWLVYESDGRYFMAVSSEEAAALNAKKGRIVRHIPAEVREV